jgi:hypothetical protein
MRAGRLSESGAPLACRKRAAAQLRRTTVQLKLDLAWILREQPTIPLEEAQEELVTLMATAIEAVATQREGKEGDDDEQRASEDQC